MVKQSAQLRENDHASGNERPTTLSIEHLESRLNLSTLSTVARQVPAGAGAAAVQNVSTTVRYRIASYAAGDAAGQYGASYTNAQYPQAQEFFDKYKSDFTPNVAPAPGTNGTTPDPTQTPDDPPPSSPAAGSPLPPGPARKPDATDHYWH